MVNGSHERQTPFSFVFSGAAVSCVQKNATLFFSSLIQVDQENLMRFEMRLFGARQS
jgi:hypothetical protein